MNYHNLQTKLLFRNDARTPLGRLTMAGFIKHSSGIQGTRVLGSYALVYLLEGSGNYHSGRRSIRVQAGDALLVFPEIAHTYGPGVGERWSEFYCVFDGPVFDLLRTTGLFQPDRPVLQLEPISHWLGRFEAILSQMVGETLAERTVAISRFAQLISELAACGTPEPLNTASWITEACQLLSEQLDQALPTEAVAQALGVPYETFRKQFQLHVGVAPARYRAVRRIDAACALLHDRRLTTQAIAVRLGFSDEFHFSRRFKQIVGMTPSDFRRRLPGRTASETD